ncbi:MAG TPA: polysaccharide deacetylase family protein [Flavitalea sp.]|nr:polysaccharide deacetylase family protein [Flavitalea sp.]
MKPSILLSIFLISGGVTFAQNPPRLIIRGDDMGYSHSGNQALIESSKNGIQQSVEVIVPSPWFPEAVTLLKANPGIDVGIHLAITSEWDNVKWRPVSDCPSLKDEDGYFYPMIWPNKNYPGRAVTENKWTTADLEKEFRAQIELALKKLPGITHVSSHMGCTGLNDSSKAMVKRLAKEYGLDIDPEVYGVKYIGYKGAHKTSAEKIKSFIAMLDDLKSGETYLFVDHPGFDSPELRAISHIGYEDVAVDRQGVTDLFTSKAVKDAIQKKKIQLISYAGLKAAK